MTKPPLTPLVANLPQNVPFVGPETMERASGRQFQTRLGANESVFGPSPAAIKAMETAAAECWKYPDPENHALKQALAGYHGVAAENIVVGEGIDGLLGYLCRLYVSQNTRVVTSDGAYPTFNFHVAGYGGNLVKVPYRNDCEDIAALLAAGADNARLIYLANPDNPMGTMHDAAAIAGMIERLPDRALLVLDEAYAEFAGKDLLPVDVSRPNVIRLRTFSKAFGMAGARVGYALAHGDIAGAFDRIRNHFGMSRVSVAGALAALEDQDYLRGIIEQVAMARKKIAETASVNGLHALVSHTNFVTIDCGQDGAFARRVLQGLIDQGVFVRMPFVAPEDRCIRVTAGREADLAIFAKALPVALAKARSAVKTSRSV